MSDQVFSLQEEAPRKKKQNSATEAPFRTIQSKSDILFRALQEAWQCSCQEYHFANLRLEHHKVFEIRFEIILTSIPPSIQGSNLWPRKELSCTQIIDSASTHEISQPPSGTHALPDQSNCTRASTQSLLSSQKRVIMAKPAPAARKAQFGVPEEPNIKLCQVLGDREFSDGKSLGTISYGNHTCHLHSSTERSNWANISPVTLDHILSTDYRGGYLGRRHRYNIALHLASSVAQLQFTPWLRNGLTKKGVLFFPRNLDGSDLLYHEPFIQQDFPAQCPVTSSFEGTVSTFYQLGILLLESCFGQRLEDHPLRRRRQPEEGETKQVLDVLAAKEWCQDLADEGGDDHASAVRWCFTGANKDNQSWQREIIKNVIWPLETCQDHFRNISTCG